MGLNTAFLSNNILASILGLLYNSENVQLFVWFNFVSTYIHMYTTNNILEKVKFFLEDYS